MRTLTWFATALVPALCFAQPANDDPCGALELTPTYGCLPSLHSNANATASGTTPPGTLSVEVPSCGGQPGSDVWYTLIVPLNGALNLSTEPLELQDAAMAVYRSVGGDCSTGDLELVLIEDACATIGSMAGEDMPALQLTGLTTGERIWVRVWRESGSDGTFTLCASRSDTPPGNCTYQLHMTDSGGDGWGGSFVTICVGAVCTDYAIHGAAGTMFFGASLGQNITLSYTPVGANQTEIEYQFLAPGGQVIIANSAPHIVGFVYGLSVNATCNYPYSPMDCSSHYTYQWIGTFGALLFGQGSVVDLHPGNQGCISTGETHGAWYRLFVQNDQLLSFSIRSLDFSPANYDFALWGPDAADICPPVGQPIRCSFAATTMATGMTPSSIDTTEDTSGDGWVRSIQVVNGESYMLYISTPDPASPAFILGPNLPNRIASGHEITGTMSITVIPNPATDHIRINGIFIAEPLVSIEVLDATGRVVLKERISAASSEPIVPINISALKSGSYVVSLHGKDGADLGRAQFVKVAE